MSDSFVTRWTVTCQAPLSMGFSRQEYWSGRLFPSPGDLPNLGTETTSPAFPELAGGFFITEPPGKPFTINRSLVNKVQKKNFYRKVGIQHLCLLFIATLEEIGSFLANIF